MEPKFTLIVLAYNDSLTIESCLNSIKNQDILEKDIQFEIISVPNGCIDDTEERIDNFFIATKEHFKNVEVRKFSLKDGHRNKALNRGILESKGDLVMYLNADCTISSNTLSEMYNIFNSNSLLKVAGPNDVPALSEIEKESLLYKMFEGESILTKLKGKYLPIGRFIAFRKSFVNKFPEDIHSEDIWIGLNAYNQFGLDGVKVNMNSTVNWTPPNNWPDYIALYTRYVHGPKQMIERYPEYQRYLDKLNMETNKYKSEDLVKIVVGELINRGQTQEEAVKYVQDYKLVRDLINENEIIYSFEIIKNDGTWQTDR